MKCSAISRLVASSTYTSSVHCGARAFEPRMLAAIDMHQLAQTRAPGPRLIDLRWPLPARHPETCIRQSAQRSRMIARARWANLGRVQREHVSLLPVLRILFYGLGELLEARCGFFQR